MGLTENSFKTRYSNHKTSFCNSNKRLSTELSKHIWHLRDNNINFKVTWKISKQAAPYNPTSKQCNLCLLEKYFIICKPGLASKKKRNELTVLCKSNANDNQRISRFVLAIYRRYISETSHGLPNVKTINHRDIGTIFAISPRDRGDIILARLRCNDISQSRTIYHHDISLQRSSL